MSTTFCKERAHSGKIKSGKPWDEKGKCLGINGTPNKNGRQNKTMGKDRGCGLYILRGKRSSEGRRKVVSRGGREQKGDKRRENNNGRKSPNKTGERNSSKKSCGPGKFFSQLCEDREKVCHSRGRKCNAYMKE